MLMHCLQKFLIDRKSRSRSDHGINTAVGAERGSPNLVNLIDPFLNLVRSENAQAVKAPAVGTSKQLIPVVAAVLVSCNEGMTTAVICTHGFKCGEREN